MDSTVFSELAIQPRLLEFGILKTFSLLVNKEVTRFQEHVVTAVVKYLNL
jgi:hypothetical protein